MSQTIDNRVVEMEFDNAAFERGISVSIASLEQLKKSLNFDGIAKGFDGLANFENLSKTAFDGIEKGTKKVQSSFSVMQIVGYTAISEITKAVMGLAGKLLSFVSGPLAQIDAGGRKRAQNIEQARFQMKGLGLDVEEAMRNSLDAVDGTAYGLDAAAKAAGQLAASGVKLGTDMTTSLRGVAGVASMTSSSFEEISPIFTTVAGQGKLMTMQLRQLENRGLNAAAVMAKAFGTTEAAVREMVTAGEVSFEMFSKAMSDAFGDQATKANDTYAGSLMNVQAALSRIGAKFYAPYLENMRQVLNGLRLVINDISAGLDPVFQVMERLMILSRTLSLKFLEGLDFSKMSDTLMRILIPAINIGVNVGTALRNIFESIGKAWSRVFPKVSIEPLISLLNYIAELTKNIGLGDTNLKRITTTFSGLFSLLKGAGGLAIIVIKGLSGVFRILGDALQVILTPVLAFTGVLGSFITEVVTLISNGAKPIEAFGYALDSLGDRLSKISPTFSSAGKIIDSALNGIGKGLSFVAGLLKNIDLDFRPITVFADETTKSLTPYANQNGNLFTRAADGMRNGLVKMKDAFSIVDSKFSSALQIIGGGLAVAFDAIGKAVEVVKPILVAGGKVISHFFNLIKEAFEGVNVIDVVNTGFFAALVIVIRNFLKPIKDFSNNVVGLMEAAQGALESYQNKLMPNILLAIGAAVLMLAGAFFIMAQVPREKLVTTLVAVSVLLVELTAAMLLLSHKVGDKGIFKLAVSMMVLSTAVLILANAVAVLGNLNFKQAAIGVAGISILIWELVAISVVLKKAQANMLKGSTSLLFFSSALYIMAYAVKNLGSMDIETLKTGLLAIASLIAMLGFFMKVSEKSMAQMPAFAAGLLLMAVALNLLVLPLLLLGKIPWQILAQGLTVITAVLTIVAFSVNAMQTIAPQLVKIGGGLLLLAVALNLLIVPLLILSVIPLEVLGKGLLMITAMLVILAAAASVMSPIQGQLISVAAGLTLLAVAINLLIIPLVVLGQMSWDSIVIGLTALAGLFLVLGVAAFALAGASGGLLIIAGGLALIGLAANLAGAGLVLLATGISALGLSLSGVATVLPVFLKAMDQLFQQILKSLEVIILNIIQSLGKILAGIIKSLLQVMIDSSPKLFELLGVVLDGILNLIAVYGPKLILVVVELIVALIQTIADHTKDFVTAALELVENFLTGIAEGIPGVAKAGADVVIAFMEAIAEQYPRIVDAGFKMVIDLMNGLNTSLKENGPILEKAMSDLAGTMLETFVGVLFAPAKGLFSTGEDIITGVIDGIKSKIKHLEEAASDAGSALLKALNGKLDINSPSKETYKSGSFAADGLADGVTENKAPIKAITDTVSLFKTALDRISPLSEKAGEDSGKATAAGIDKSRPVVKEAAQKTAEEVAAVLKKEDEARQASYNASKAWIEEEKFYKRMALAEELAAWQRVQAKYAEGTEQRKQADREVFTLEQNINTAYESYETNKEALRNKRNESRKQLEDDYYNKVKETNDKLKADVKGLNDAYDEAVKSRASALYDVYNLFDAVDTPEAVTGDTLITNLQSQIDAFDSWQKNIASLAKKGIDDGLMTELEKMGPSASANIEALNQMTSEQLSTYVSMWKTKNTQVNTEAITELESLKISTAAKIVELTTTAATELENYKITWKNSLKALNADSEAQMQALKDSFMASMYGLNAGTAAQFNTLGAQVQTSLTKTSSDAAAIVSAMAVNLQKIMQNNTSWVNVGENIVKGVIQGVNNQTAALVRAIQAMAAAAEQAAKAKLKIKSPSRVFTSIGEYATLGFINGIVSLIPKVASAAETMGQTAMDGINSAISNIVDAVSSDSNFSPIITPVLNLDSVKDGMRNISDILNQDNTIASTIANPKKSQGINSENANSATQKTGATITFKQYNYSPKALSRLDIYRQTNNQISAMKGMVNA